MRRMAFDKVTEKARRTWVLWRHVILVMSMRELLLPLGWPAVS